MSNEDDTSYKAKSTGLMAEIARMKKTVEGLSVKKAEADTRRLGTYSFDSCKKPYRRWTEEESLKLKAFREDGKSLAWCAKELKRDKSVVTQKCIREGYVKIHWAEKLADLIEYYLSIGYTPKDISLEIGIVEAKIRYVITKKGVMKRIKEREFETFVVHNYAIIGMEGCVDQTGREQSEIRKIVYKYGLNKVLKSRYTPALGKKDIVGAYTTAKSIRFLQRDSKASIDKFDDCTILIYPDCEPGVPIIALQTYQILFALEKYFGREFGALATALKHGTKAK